MPSIARTRTELRDASTEAAARDVGGDPPHGAPDRELVLVSTGMVSIPPVNGGAVEAYVADLARIFTGETGYHVSVISNHRNPMAAPRDRGTHWVATHSPIDSFPLRPAPSVLAHAIGGSISAAVAVRHLGRLDGSGPTIVHLNEEISAMAFARLHRRVGRVFTVHNPPPSTGDANYGGFEYALRHTAARATWRFALRTMDAVVALTPWIRRLLVEDWYLAADRVHVLPLPVDVATFRPAPEGFGPPDDGWNLLFVGRLEARKNVLAAVEALAYLPDRAHLTVVGDGPMAHATRRRARELGVLDRLEVRSRIPAPGLVEEYRRSTLLLHPSYLEAYPRVVVEAAACGLPSLVPRTPMYSSFVDGGCAVAFDPSEGARGLAETVHRTVTDGPGLAALRRSARAMVLRENAYPAFGERLARVYDTALP